MDPALTTTGIIATILAVIFATAAYFVQRKKRQINAVNNHGSNSSQQVHVSTTRHGTRKDRKEHDPVPELKMPDENTGPEESQKRAPPTSNKPVFKKYSAKGTQEESPNLGDDDEVLWE